MKTGFFVRGIYFFIIFNVVDVIHVILLSSAGDVTSTPTFAPTNLASPYRWSMTSKLFASDAMASTYFGTGIAIDGDNLVIGAHRGPSDYGAAYYYVKTNSQWSQISKIEAYDKAQFDFFGVGIGIRGDVLMIGSIGDIDAGIINVGSVYIFNKISSQWTLSSKLSPPDPHFATGQGGQQFGYSIAFDDATLMVGAVTDSSAINRAGAVYVYDKVQSEGWSLQSKLFSPVPHDSDIFGAVTFFGDNALISSQLYDDESSNQGRVFVYKRVSNKWSCLTFLKAIDPANGDQFGIDMAMHNDVAFIGSLSDHYGSNAGAAYMYVRMNDAWTFLTRLQPPESINEITFSNSISFDGQNIAAGARFDDTKATDAGSAYTLSFLYFSSMPTTSPTRQPSSLPTTMPSSLPSAVPTWSCTAYFQYAFGVLGDENVLFSKYFQANNNETILTLQKSKPWKLGIHSADFVHANLTIMARMIGSDFDIIGDWTIQNTLSDIQTTSLKSLRGLNIGKVTNVVLGAIVEDINHRLHYYTFSACDRKWTYQAALQLHEYYDDISSNTVLGYYDDLLQ